MGAGAVAAEGDDLGGAGDGVGDDEALEVEDLGDELGGHDVGGGAFGHDGAVVVRPATAPPQT